MSRVAGGNCRISSRVSGRRKRSGMPGGIVPCTRGVAPGNGVADGTGTAVELAPPVPPLVPDPEGGADFFVHASPMTTMQIRIASKARLIFEPPPEASRALPAEERLPSVVPEHTAGLPELRYSASVFE